MAGPVEIRTGGYKMAATAGTLYAKGLKTGTTYAIDVYVPDAVADVIRFDSGAGAGSTSSVDYSFPEDVVIYDASFAAAPTATRVRLTGNGVPSANTIRYGSYAYNLNNRPLMNVKVRAGTRIGGVNL